MLNEDEKLLPVYNYNYSIDLNDVPLLSIIKLDKNTVTRFDILINKFYRGDLRYLKLLLDFNSISDISKCRVGDLIKIPDFQYLESYMTITEDNVLPPGISLHKNKPINTGGTVALPKLNLIKRPVQYDAETGNIIF